MDPKVQIDFIKGLTKVIFKFEPDIFKKTILPKIIPIMKGELSTCLLQIAVDLLVNYKDYLQKFEFERIIWP